MEQEMKLQPEYYNFILNGTKRIEIRLFDEKRQQIKIGDIIKIQIKEISNNASNPWQLGCRMRIDYLLDNNIVGSEDIALHYHYNPIINRIIILITTTHTLFIIKYINNNPQTNNINK